MTLSFVDDFFNSTRVDGVVGGLKLRPNHLLAQLEKWAALFKRHGTRIVWNFRGNLFKQAVGEYDLLVHAKRTRREGLVKERPADETPKFRVEHMQALQEILLFKRNCEQDIEHVLMGPIGE